MTESLRVLSFLRSFQSGGVERDVLRFTKAWRREGIDARVAIGYRSGLLEVEAANVPCIGLSSGDSAGRFATLRMVARFPRVIRTIHPHVLLFASNNHAIVALAMRLWLGRRCPPIVLRVSMDLTRRDMSALALRIDRYALRVHAWAWARVVAMALPAKAQIIEEMALPPERVVVINNASMTNDDLRRYVTAADKCRERDAARQGRCFIGVGRLMPQKNFALLVEAFARIAEPDDVLVIVGEGPEQSAIEQCARKHGVFDRVRLPGYQFDIENWLADADFFVLSSDFEGVPAVIVEALAAGLPIVATDCCATAAMLVEDAGYLVPIQDPAALAKAMDMICDLPVDRAMMRARAALFTTEATTAEWISLFESIRR